MVCYVCLENWMSMENVIQELVLIQHAIDRRFEEWRKLGIFDRTWIRLLKIYEHKIEIKWNWQSLDSISVKSPLGGR
jgi:hypothetical protein